MTLKLKIDLHVHTVRSPDAFTTPSQLSESCKQANIDGVAITEHNRATLELPRDILAIRGIEVSSSGGHVIGLGVREPIQRGLSPEETIRQIKRQSGLAILPHPYDLFRPNVRPDRLRELPDAIEVVNSASLFARFTWPPAKKYATKKKLAQVAGSDSHIPQTIGTAYTIVDSDSHNESSILEAIRSGRTTPVGKQVSIGQRVRKLSLNIRQLI